MHGHSLGQHEDDDAGMLPVSITISVVAVLMALVSLLGHRAHTRALMAQNRMNDAWVHYQSQALARINYNALLDFLSFAQVRDPAVAGKMKTKYEQQHEQAAREQKETEAEATRFDLEVEHRETAADRFDLADVLFEAAVVVISVTLLTKRRLYWGIGLGLASMAAAVGATGLFVS